MAGDREDELAHDRTAPAPPSERRGERDLVVTETEVPQRKRPSKESLAGPKMLGRYRIEGELGAGGMGIVYAAFDPELERRVALKVLLSPDGDDAHKQRLLREARAMARLTHPNVVTVHEVKTVDGRDYVAMELIEGESLAEWLRKEQRSEDAILGAFLAAGRGLAAAHAAGMVHRDFKPHNVLRSKLGRIAVTDFGLAREAHADPLAITGVATAPVAGTAVGTGTPSTPLAGLTMTGSVLGTPAYMAPEQWAGGAVTPATDQFAFCVAMWEAFAGERPFRGDTVEMLKRAVELGPAPLDDSKLPRRLRPVLRRGLDPSPSKRFPSMDALLSEITPPTRPWLALGLGVIALVAIVLYLAFGRSSEPAGSAVATSCPEPAMDPAGIALPDRPLEAAAISADIERWRVARVEACQLDPKPREERVACLDHVLSRLKVIADAVRKLGKDTRPVDPGRYLIDPAVCKSSPHLEPASAKLADAFTYVIRQDANGEFDRDAAEKLLKRVEGDPCASAWGHLLAANIPDPGAQANHSNEAEQAGESCRDDRIRAEIAIHVAAAELDRTTFGLPKTAKLKRAVVAVERVSQADVVADLDALRVMHAYRAEDLDEAIRHGTAAVAGFTARDRLAAQIEGEITIADLRKARGTPEDFEWASRRTKELSALARAKLGPTHPITRRLERATAMLVFEEGDAVAAKDMLDRLREPVPITKPRKIHVRVVSEGRPVPNAIVTAGAILHGGGNSPAFASSTTASTMRSATTGENGEVSFEAVAEGIVVAQAGDRWSRPAMIGDRVTLELEPTSRLEGNVELRGALPRNVALAVEDRRNPPTLRYEIIAPVKPDGSFVIDGVPRAKIRLYAALQSGTARSLKTLEVVVDKPILSGLKIAIADDSKKVYVIVRSTVAAPVGGAQVFVQPGALKSTSLDKWAVDSSAAIRWAKPADAKTPPPLRSQMRTGDLLAIVSAPSGPLSACAIGLPAELDSTDLDRKVRDNLHKIEVRCVAIPVGADSIVVEVPPWPRLE